VPPRSGAEVKSLSFHFLLNKYRTCSTGILFFTHLLFRVRIAAAELLGEMCKQFGPRIYQRISISLLPLISSTLDVQARCLSNLVLILARIQCCGLEPFWSNGKVIIMSADLLTEPNLLRK